MDHLLIAMENNFTLADGETDLEAADPVFAAKPSETQDLSHIGRVVIDKDLSINFIRPNAPCVFFTRLKARQ